MQWPDGQKFRGTVSSVSHVCCMFLDAANEDVINVINQVDNVIKRQALRILWGCTYKQKCYNLTALNLAVISYSLHDSSYASSILLRMIDWI